jgi:hypothetical protein
MTAPTHACPGGCGGQVLRSLLACRDCWRRLPTPYRDAVHYAYDRRASNPRAHRAAVIAAYDWYRQHPAEAGAR